MAFQPPRQFQFEQHRLHDRGRAGGQPHDLLHRHRRRPEQVGNRSLVVFDSGDEVTVQAGDQGIRFLLVSGSVWLAAGVQVSSTPCRSRIRAE